MSYDTFTLDQAANHIHLPANELRHYAQRGEIEAAEYAGDWHFEHRILDEWAQRNLLAAGKRELAAQHRAMTEARRRTHQEDWNIADLFTEQAVDLALTAKAKAGILRDMTDLADRSGFVYDPDALFRELVAREEAASTAIGEGIALLHPRFHDPYLFERPFIAYGRSERPIFFGAADGAGTQHFLLICSTDHAAHLHTLARLAVLVHGSDFTKRLGEAADVASALEAVRACESEFLR